MIWIFKKAGETNNRNKEYQFWQQDNHPIELNFEDIFKSKMNYLHYNPVKVGLVREEKECLLSSGVNYYGDREG